jgi:hypothetical protein
MSGELTLRRSIRGVKGQNELKRSTMLLFLNFDCTTEAVIEQLRFCIYFESC